MSLNKVLLIGNVGKEPVIRGEGDRKAANFSLATSFGAGDNAKTEWHNIVAFGKSAEFAEKYVKKGTSLFIEGRLQTRQYEKDGVTRYSTEVVAVGLQFAGPKPVSKDEAPGEDLPF